VCRAKLTRLLPLLLTALPAAAVAKPHAERHVLLLNAYHQGYRWTDDLTAAIGAALGEMRGVEIHVEYMDTKRWIDEPRLSAMSDLLHARYGEGGVRPDVAIVADDHALDFALAHRDGLFRGVPLVFAGINDFRPSRIAGFEDVSGVFEAYDFRGTLETILRLHPNTRRLIAVGDETRSGRAAMDRVRRAASDLEGARVEYLIPANTDELVAELKGAGPDAVVLYVSFLRASDGRLLTLEQSRRLIASTSPVPVYCFWDYFDGTGLTGGRGMSAENQGATVGAIVLRLLRGEDADAIGVVDLPPNPYLFDHQQMKRFGLELADLPAHSIVRNRSDSFYARNWGWIWGIVVFLLLEGLLVAGYLTARRRRRTLEGQLQRSQQLEAVGRLAGGVAHDFRNLLTVIRGFCEMLLEDSRRDTEDRRLLLEILGAAKKGALLTAQLLSFSRRQSLAPVVLNLNTVIAELRTSLGRMIGEDVVLRFEPDSSLANTRLDRAQLEQMVLNLANNARDAMPHGGQLTLSTESAAEGGQRFARLRVADSGCGMSEAVRAQAFDPFFTTKGVGEGTGLGLSMAYGLVKQSHGTIRVESAPGAGTEFIIDFPAVDEAVEIPRAPSIPPASPDRAAHSGGEGRAILVVEDNPVVLHMVTRSLERSGYRVVSTTDPTDAERIAGAHADQIGLLLTDVVMPEVQGPEVAARVRAVLPGLPVLFMSAYTPGSGTHLDTLPPGASRLTKPFSPAELIDRVRALLEQGVD